MSIDRKKIALSMLRNSQVIYVIMSQCTHLPYVACDTETYDDEIFVYFTEKEAKEKAGQLIKEKNPVQILKVENKSFLVFYTSLYSMGVNCLVVGDGTSQRTAVQLDDFIHRPSGEKLPKGQVRVENPEFHLTAIYFVQELRKQQNSEQNAEMTKELKELNDEMLVHFREGRFILATQEDKGIPILKQKDGQVYQPLFTDIQEFQKFNRENKFKALVIDSDKIVNVLSKESVGVVVNPFGVNVRFQIARKDMKKTR